MIEEFLDMMPDTITLEPFTALTTDGYTKPQYGAAVAYRGRVEIRATRWINAQGKELVARGRVILGIPRSATIPSTRDRLTLPADFGPAQPNILDVQPQRDESGRHHVTLVIA